jgi:hypothetical protein
MGRSKHLYSLILSTTISFLGQSYCLAEDERSVMCDARRSTGAEYFSKNTPDFERRCFAFGMELLADAIGRAQNLEDAEGVFETLLRMFPESSYPFIGYAELGMRKREMHVPVTHSDPSYNIRELAERATRVKTPVPQSFVTLGRADLLVGCLACAEKSVATARERGASGPSFQILQSLIADLHGDMSRAESILTTGLSSLSRSEDKSELHIALAAHYIRYKKLDDAERELSNAVSAAPKKVAPGIKLSEFLLYTRGNPEKAKRAAEKANTVTVTIAAKRVVSMADYLYAAQIYSSGKSADKIKRVSQTSVVSPEEAFVLGARHIPLSSICEVLLKAGIVRNPDVKDDDGNTGLIAAGIGANGKIAQQLVARGANVNGQNKSGERALSWFIYNRDHEAVMLLLKSGAEINYMDVDGSSPLSLAVQRRNAPAVTELLRRKARISGAGVWPAGDLLGAAALTGDVETVKALVDGGIKVDALDREGHSALVTAVILGQISVVKLLLERGASPRVALEFARKAGNREILDMLVNATRPSV